MRPRLLGFLFSIVASAAFAVVTPLPGVTPQSSLAFQPFSVPLAVRVLDDQGRPVAGADVGLVTSFAMRFEDPIARDCYLEFMSVLVCRTVSGGDGIARFGIATPQRAQAMPVQVRAWTGQYPQVRELGEIVLDLRADPATPLARITIVGNDQRAVIGTPLAPIRVRVEGPDGRPRRQAALYYGPTSGGPGGFEHPGGNPEVRTDDDGYATLPPLIASWGVGPQEAEVRYLDAESGAFMTEKIRYTATNAQGGTILEVGALWWGGATQSGWGMSVFQHDDRLFNVWFVYDDAGRPTWFVQPSGTWTQGVGSINVGSLYRPTGAPWFAYDATRFNVGAEIGRGQVGFNGPDAGHSNFFHRTGLPSFTFNREVRRQQFGRGEAAPITGVGDLWWGGPSQNGWGVAIHEQAGTLFMVWFTYDASGQPTWFVMPGGNWTQRGSYSGTVYRTSGPWWVGPFDASRVTTQAVGSFDLLFSSTQRATMDVSIDGRSVVLKLERQGF